ncbi:TPR repeat-containing protein [Calothrix sp. PCC 7716]|nr:TPR repeat-containing protein [Calothrix sp. PCC 7716]
MNEQRQQNNSQIAFFMHLLQLSLDSEANHELVYPVLEENLDKIDERLIKILHYMAEYNQLNLAAADGISAFSNLIQWFPLGNKATNLEISIAGYEVASAVYAQEKCINAWGVMQCYLADAYFERIRGERADNLEKAIDISLNTLKLITREISPELWANIQQSLGNVYIYRVQGDKGENLENAINIFNQILKVISYNADPYIWASIQNSLGTAYLDRIQEDHSENVEFAINAYQQALKVRAYELKPHDWAQTQNNLGQAYLARVEGNRQENVELAITAYQNALQVFTIETDPQTWALVKNNLANAYSHSLNGGAAENLELAIEMYEEALQVYTRDAFPLAWAKLKTDLAGAYKRRIFGNRAENLEKAIFACEEALEIRHCKADALTWAVTLHTLAEIYIARIYGSKAENIDQAIFNYHQALQIYTSENDARTWATIQSDLANAYRLRILGERAENLEKSLTACKEALQVRTREANPQTWAASQRYLALTYLYRVRGNRAENLELGIFACQQALEVYTREAFPTAWADAQNDLGVIYEKRIQGNRKENLEFAIKIYEQVLQEVYTRDAFPHSWAGTLTNLALAYTLRIEGDEADNLEKAINAYQEVLQIYTRDEFPQDWAITQHNLALAYYDRIQGERLDNLNKSITACHNALEIYNRHPFIQERAAMYFYLGNAHLDGNDFSTAYHAYNKAIKSVDNLHNEVYSGQEVKQKIAERWYKLYQQMVRNCLELNKITEALEYVERSKNRSLVELILERDRKTIFPSDVVTQLEQLRDQLAAGQYQLQSGTAENPAAIVQHLQELRQQRQELQDKYLPVGSGFKFKQFLSTLDNKTAVIEWYITGDKILSFIIKPKPQTPFSSDEEAEITVWQSQPEDLTALISWWKKYIQDYYQQKHEWQNQLESRLKNLAEILHIEEILSQIPKQYDKLILIPHRYLHLFPLHALPIQESCLLELFPNGVSYAPSCQLLQLSQQRQREDFQSIFAIQNPTDDLLFTDLEVNSILPLFSSHQVLPKTQATKTALSQVAPQLEQANYLHFSSHGLFNPNSPLDSCLVLAGANEEEALDLSKCLTLGNLFDRNFDLNQCCLVTLSACETGLIDFNNTSDEYIGLPSGFIYAGAKSVVSSLWTVNDLSTALLMIRFYQNLKAGLMVPIALNQAQVWLRDSTQGDLWEWAQQLSLAKGFEGQIHEYLSWFDREEVPFEKTVYWGAFCTVGC